MSTLFKKNFLLPHQKANLILIYTQIYIKSPTVVKESYNQNFIHMQKIFFTKKNEPLPSNFDDKIETLLSDGARKVGTVPRRFNPNLICIIKNGEKSEAVSFEDIKEFTSFRNTVLRLPSGQDSTAWLEYSRP